jgi:HlyD family secretion protein
MIKKLGLPTLAIIGAIIGLIAVGMSAKKKPPQPILFPPPIPPYLHFIAGSGTVESASQNIQIGTSIAEVVTDVFVKAGDVVKKDTPLFQLDIRTPLADLQVAQKAFEKALFEYENYKTQLSLYDKLTDKRAVSQNEYNQIFFQTQTAKASLEEAKAKIALAQSIIDRSTIRAPIDGTVLQVEIRKGEIANLNPFNNIPLITFGPICPFHVRINIDEDDAWRYKKGSSATAFIRGNSSIYFPLRFVRIEPLIIPKPVLTGSTSERVDTRVLQVIYAFDCDRLPVFAGQNVDVFIESLPANIRYMHEQNSHH